MALVTTPGAVDANSYTELASALLRAAIDPRGATFAAIVSSSDQEALLAMATVDVDGALLATGRLDGSKASADQALEFPRSTATIPHGIVLATQLLAFHYAERKSLGEIGTPIADTSNVKRDKTDVLETEYFEPTVAALSLFDALPQHVRAYLAAFLVPSFGTWGTGTVVRGS